MTKAIEYTIESIYKMARESCHSRIDQHLLDSNIDFVKQYIHQLEQENNERLLEDIRNNDDSNNNLLFVPVNYKEVRVLLNSTFTLNIDFNDDKVVASLYEGKIDGFKFFIFETVHAIKNGKYNVKELFNSLIRMTSRKYNNEIEIPFTFNPKDSGLDSYIEEFKRFWQHLFGE